MLERESIARPSLGEMVPNARGLDAGRIAAITTWESRSHRQAMMGCGTDSSPAGSSLPEFAHSDPATLPAGAA